MEKKLIFDAVRRLLGRGFKQDEVALLNQAIDAAIHSSQIGNLHFGSEPARKNVLRLGVDGELLIKRWEGCHKRRADGLFVAYPDPGSDDGRPWTIGWGTTGPQVGRNTVWTSKQCDEAFQEDLHVIENEVSAAIGAAPTTQNQFDALVSFHYNTGAIARARLTAFHRDRNYEKAKLEFLKWVHNDGKPLKGLRRRRLEEADLYSK